MLEIVGLTILFICKFLYKKSMYILCKSNNSYNNHSSELYACKSFEERTLYLISHCTSWSASLEQSDKWAIIFYHICFIISSDMERDRNAYIRCGKTNPRTKKDETQT
jgi:hypothetical protein